MKLTTVIKIAPLLIGVAVGLFVAVLQVPGLLTPLTQTFYQLQFSLRGSEMGSADLALIEIDQESVDVLGTFPWPRSRHALAIERLEQLGAQAIVFAISFQGETPDDARFAGACRRAGNVYLPVRPTDTEIGIQYKGPPTTIRSAVRGLGHSALAASTEESVAALPLDHGHQGDGYFALSLLASLTKLGIHPSEILPPQAGRYRIGPLSVPIDAKRRMRINYAGTKDAFTTIPYANLLSSGWEQQKARVQGRIVIIGITAPDHASQYPVPWRIEGGQMPELFVHANALDTLLRQRFLTLAIVPWWLYPLLLAPLAWLLDKIPRGWRRGVAFGFSGALPLLTALLFIGNRLFFDPVGPMLGLLLCHALISYWQTARRAQRLRAYVPSHLAESNERQLGPEGERKRVVVLFADVSSFTSWAEAHEPEIIYPLMQECIQILVEETYRAGGTIDKFTGDGIMALFGIPTPNAKDARRAVTAALNMQACLASFNQAHKEELDAPLQIRIGINVGPVVIGSVGSSERRDFTALGDTVNVAARLEQTAEPGTILVSEAILSAIADDFAFEPRGSLALKNRAQPVDTFQILALPKPAGQEAVLS